MFINYVILKVFLKVFWLIFLLVVLCFLLDNLGGIIKWFVIDCGEYLFFIICCFVKFSVNVFVNEEGGVIRIFFRFCGMLV